MPGLSPQGLLAPRLLVPLIDYVISTATLLTGLRYKVGPRLCELAPRGQRGLGGEITQPRAQPAL